MTSHCLILCALLSVTACSRLSDQEGHHECKEVKNDVCTNYLGRETWYGRFPNSLGLDEDESFAEFFNFFAVTYQDNYCSHMLIPLLCYHYFPLCSPECPRLSVTPSRQLCTEAVEACLPYARVLYGETFNSTFPEDLDCSNFPDANYLAYDMECIENTSNALQPCQCASTVYIDSPNPAIFIHFNLPIGGRVYQVMENESFAEVCVILANTGSYDPTWTTSIPVSLTFSTEATKNSFLPSATKEEDYLLPVTSLTIPADSVRGATYCINITVVDDYLQEGRESFNVKVSSTNSTSPIEFGSSRAGSSVGSVKVIIIDNDEPSIPASECKNKCSIRSRANANTFSQNLYTYAAHVVAIGRRDTNSTSLLDVLIIECWEVEPDACSRNNSRYSIPTCRDCYFEFESGEEYLVAGRHTLSNIYLPNYRKGGLLAPWKNSYGSVGEWVHNAATQQDR